MYPCTMYLLPVVIGGKGTLGGVVETGSGQASMMAECQWVQGQVNKGSQAQLDSSRVRRPT
jgi:hypothetical protein